MATINDLLSRATDSNTGRPVTAKLGGAKTLGAASITLNVNTNWTTASPVYIAIYTTTAAGIKDPNSQTDWKGILTGTTINNLTLTGGVDRAYTTDAYVEITFTSRWAKDMYDWGTTQHNLDGTHKAITTDTLAVTSGTTLPNNDIQANELATNAITLGYAQITTNFTTTSTSDVQVTGLTVNVTIPAGGRRVKITVYARSLNNSAASVYNQLTIWAGTVGTGTKLTEAQNFIPGANQGSGLTAIAVHNPAAGAVTYNVGLRVTGGTANLEANALYPGFVLVEAI